MKINYKWALLLCCLGSALVGCNATTENKARQLEQEQEEVIEAVQAGESPNTIDAKKADVEHTRQEFKKVWDRERSILREKVNTEIEYIDNKLASYERRQQEAGADKVKTYDKAIASLKDYRDRMSNQLLTIDTATATSWTKVKTEVENLTDYTDYKVTTIIVD